MLDPGQIDLSDLAHALQDHSGDHEWWFDPRSGELVLWSEGIGDESDEGHPDERGLVLVEPIPSHDAYDDMADFADRLADPDLARRLERALAGRGAFRRFKDELLAHPDQRADWHRFSDARMTRRAAAWLADQDLITAQAHDALVAGHPDPAPTAVPAGRAQLAFEVARELRKLFGDRLSEVRVFGSSARGDEAPESDLDLLVVLSGEVDFWADRALMDEILWRHTLSSGIVVSALPVSVDDATADTHPALTRALAEGISVR